MVRARISKITSRHFAIGARIDLILSIFFYHIENDILRRFGFLYKIDDVTGFRITEYLKRNVYRISPIHKKRTKLAADPWFFIAGAP